MVLVTGAAVGSIATLPAAVALLGPAGASAAAAATVSGSAAIALPGAGAGATVLALGEGALVGLGATFGGGSSAGIALATAAGPMGWLVVGYNKNNDRGGGSGYTWDCWKPIIRDTSTQPSSGMYLRCLAAHQNVRFVSLEQGELLVGNIFGERFRLSPVAVEGALALHASIIS